MLVKILPIKARAGLAIGLMSVLALQGCASSSAMQAEIANHAQQTQERIDRLSRVQESAMQQPAAVRADFPWVASERVPLRVPLPPRFSESIVISEPSPTSAQRLLARISEMTGLRFDIDNDVFEVRSREGSAASNGGAAPGAPGGRSADSTALPRTTTVTLAPGNQGEAVAPTAGRSAGGAAFSLAPEREQMVTLVFNGSVHAMLDALTGAMGVNWRYDRNTGRVAIFRFETRTLRIAMVPGAIDSNAALGFQVGGAEAGSKVTGSLDFWGSLRQSVSNKLSAQGMFSLNESTGLLTVRDRPDVLARIQEYVSRVNDNFARQVTIDVAVYRVAVNDSDRKGMNLQLAIMTRAGRLGFQLWNPRNESTPPGTFVMAVPSNANSQWAGSHAFLDLLSSIGQASIVTSSTLHTINNQPVPMRVVRRLNYLREVARSGSGDDVTATLTPGELEVGFSMQMLPHVQENGRDLVMQVMMTLSALDRMDTFASAGNSIQLPQISSRDFLQRVWLQSGQSLVLVGFEHDEQRSDNSGMLGTGTWFMGNQAATRQRERLVIVLTPSVRNMVSPS